jgi:GT2 family glycosyltransferase
MTSVRASLIVLNFNGEGVIEACIESLSSASGPHDEIIVVDNASTDGSADRLKGRGDIQFLPLVRNTFIFGLNHGLAAAAGQYVAFLNNDIVVDADFVERCVERFADGEDVFAVCPRILEMTGAEQGSRTAGEWRRGMIFFRTLPHVEQPTDCFFAVGGQSFFRKDMILEIGSIDPLFWPMYHEDVELSYRAWKRGWRVRYAPAAVAHHVGGHSTNRAFTKSQLRSFVRQNEFLIVWKNVTDSSLLAQHFLFLAPRLAAAVLKKDWPTLRGFGRAARRLPAALRSRRQAGAHMRLRDQDVLRRISSIR